MLPGREGARNRAKDDRARRNERVSLARVLCPAAQPRASAHWAGQRRLRKGKVSLRKTLPKEETPQIRPSQPNTMIPQLITRSPRFVTHVPLSQGPCGRVERCRLLVRAMVPSSALIGWLPPSSLPFSDCVKAQFRRGGPVRKMHLHPKVQQREPKEGHRDSRMYES